MLTLEHEAKPHAHSHSWLNTLSSQVDAMESQLTTSYELLRYKLTGVVCEHFCVKRTL